MPNSSHRRDTAREDLANGAPTSKACQRSTSANLSHRSGSLIVLFVSSTFFLLGGERGSKRREVHATGRIRRECLYDAREAASKNKREGGTIESRASKSESYFSIIIIDVFSFYSVWATKPRGFGFPWSADLLLVHDPRNEEANEIRSVLIVPNHPSHLAGNGNGLKRLRSSITFSIIPNQSL